MNWRGHPWRLGARCAQAMLEEQGFFPWEKRRSLGIAVSVYKWVGGEALLSDSQ